MKEKFIRNKSYSKAQAWSQTSSAGLRDAAFALSRQEKEEKQKAGHASFFFNQKPLTFIPNLLLCNGLRKRAL